MEPEVMKMLAIALATGLGMIGPALAIGLIGFSAMQGIARNPEASGKILINMMLVTAFAEAIGIYVLIVALILIFVG